jgi:hypothetical protein
MRWLDVARRSGEPEVDRLSRPIDSAARWISRTGCSSEASCGCPLSGFLRTGLRSLE